MEVNKLEMDKENNMEDGETKNRKTRNRNKEPEIQRDQNKFFVDVSKDQPNKEMILGILAQANRKDMGREIILKDLVLAALPKLTPKDIEKIQEGCLTPTEKLQREWKEHNKKHSVTLTFEEFLIKRLGLS